MKQTESDVNKPDVIVVCCIPQREDVFICASTSVPTFTGLLSAYRSIP
jgi:hypothetical protein